jgi:hypothetical protein
MRYFAEAITAGIITSTSCDGKGFLHLRRRSRGTPLCCSRSSAPDTSATNLMAIAEGRLAIAAGVPTRLRYIRADDARRPGASFPRSDPTRRTHCSRPQEGAPASSESSGVSSSAYRTTLPYLSCGASPCRLRSLHRTDPAVAVFISGGTPDLEDPDDIPHGRRDLARSCDL